MRFINNPIAALTKTDVEMSDWKPDDTKHLYRTTSYIKPLNGSIGPKQTKCHITDVQEHGDYDQYVSMLTTTRTPDVPSGGVFSVKTRTCLTWAGANSTKVVVTTTVEWTGKSWVKGVSSRSTGGRPDRADPLFQASLKSPLSMVRNNSTTTSRQVCGHI